MLNPTLNLQVARLLLNIFTTQLRPVIYPAFYGLIDQRYQLICLFFLITLIITNVHLPVKKFQHYL